VLAGSLVLAANPIQALKFSKGWFWLQNSIISENLSKFFLKIKVQKNLENLEYNPEFFLKFELIRKIIQKNLEFFQITKNKI
jgi:hypothetical protein